MNRRKPTDLDRTVAFIIAHDRGHTTKASIADILDAVCEQPIEIVQLLLKSHQLAEQLEKENAR